jgi:predicted metalloprotease
MERRVRVLLAVAAIVLTSPLIAMSPVSAQSTPQAQRYGGDQGYARQFADLLVELDAFWLGIFQASGIAYRTPGVVPLEQQMDTGCGPVGPEDFALYCPRDESIYYSPQGFAEHDARIGDFGPVVVVAHEWGHHVQHLLGIVPRPGNAFELQADCLAGVYASDAGQRGLLDPGDITEALNSSAEAGDPLGLPQDAPGAHGINDDRVTSFMRGYIDGVSGCDLSLVAGPPATVPGPAPATGNAPSLDLSALVPSQLDLPHGQPFRLFEEGATTLDRLAESFPDPAEATNLLETWGWHGNLYRYFASDNPPPDAAGWVELSIHRFATADDAAAALPYFVAGRAQSLGLTGREVGLFGDQTEALGGPAFNGTEFTIYARRGNLLIRATGIAPDGDPRADVTQVALFPLRQLIDNLGVVTPGLSDALPPPAVMPAGLAPAGDVAKSAATIADTFADPDEAGRLFQSWGWREHIGRSFAAPGAGTANGTTQFDVAIYRFAEPWGASQALPYFLEARAAALDLQEIAAPLVGDEARAIAGPVEGGQEVTLYVRVANALLRLTAVGSGDPMADIEMLIGPTGYRSSPVISVPWQR